VSETDARLFIAAEVPPAIRAAFASVRDRLSQEAPAARWVRAEGMHLTFKFLGATPRARIRELGESVEGVARRTPPFRLVTGRTGVFGAPRRPRVLWLALEGEIEASLALAGSVEAALAPLGFAPEERPFRPHLTLARFENARGGALPEVVRAALESSLAGAPFPVDAVSLFESVLGRGGARYEAHRTCALNGPAPPGRERSDGRAGGIVTGGRGES